MALGDKVAELQQIVGELRERLDIVGELLNEVRGNYQGTLDRLRDHETEHALLKREVEEHRKWKDDQKKQEEERSRRLWAFGPTSWGRSSAV